jgi:hypothetical protein
LRRRQLTSLDLQCLNPLLRCGGPAGVGCDGWHAAIASPTHPWEGKTGGEIDRGISLAPPDYGMEFGSSAMPNTPYILCYFNGPFLLTCPRVLQIVELVLTRSTRDTASTRGTRGGASCWAPQQRGQQVAARPAGHHGGRPCSPSVTLALRK